MEDDFEQQDIWFEKNLFEKKNSFADTSLLEAYIKKNIHILVNMIKDYFRLKRRKTTVIRTNVILFMEQ